MAQIYDHRPRTAGAGPAPSEFEGAVAGLAAFGRGQENLKEAKRREAAFQRDQERWDTEQQIMGMRLEEAQRQHGEAAGLREMQRALFAADIEDPQGQWHNIVQERLGPKQQAALERMRADKRVPPEAIAHWLDDQGDRFRIQDMMEGLQTFSDRAQRVLQHTAGEGDASPVEDQVGGLVESIKADPSPENLRRVTTELHKLEADFNFEQDAYKAWERAQIDLDEAIVAENSTIPQYGKPDYEEYREVVNRIRSSERWEFDKGPNKERHITDYAGLLYDAKAYLDHDGERRAEQRIGARLKRQATMRQDNPELYARLDPTGAGRVSEREFALAQAREDEAESYRGAAGVPQGAPGPAQGPGMPPHLEGVEPAEVVPTEDEARASMETRTRVPLKSFKEVLAGKPGETLSEFFAGHVGKGKDARRKAILDELFSIEAAGGGPEAMKARLVELGIEPSRDVFAALGEEADKRSKRAGQKEAAQPRYWKRLIGEIESGHPDYKGPYPTDTKGMGSTEFIRARAKRIGIQGELTDAEITEVLQRAGVKAWKGKK